MDCTINRPVLLMDCTINRPVLLMDCTINGHTSCAHGQLSRPTPSLTALPLRRRCPSVVTSWTMQTCWECRSTLAPSIKLSSSRCVYLLPPYRAVAALLPPIVQLLPFLQNSHSNRWQNKSGGVSAECIAAQAPGEASKCFFAQRAHQFVRTPIFPINRYPGTTPPPSAYFSCALVSNALVSNALVSCSAMDFFQTLCILTGTTTEYHHRVR
jgi:hypothetical protein